MTALPRVAERPTQTVRSARVREIAVCALAVLESEGSEALTMRRLASELGIKAPSLYKHVASRDAVDVLLLDDALFDMGDRAHAALDRARGDATVALLRTYRSYGRSHPNLYRLTTAPLAHRDQLTPGVEQWAGETFFRATGHPHTAQALWAAAHGLLILEIDQRFLPGSNLDRTWAAAAAAFRRP